MLGKFYTAFFKMLLQLLHFIPSLLIITFSKYLPSTQDTSDTVLRAWGNSDEQDQQIPTFYGERTMRKQINTGCNFRQ